MFLFAFPLLNLTDPELLNRGREGEKCFSMELNAQIKFLRVLRDFGLITSDFLLSRKQWS